MNKTRLVLLPALVASLCAFGFETGARAADIATVVGTPATTSWVNACMPAGAPAQPSGSSQLTSCGGGAGCLHRVDIDNNAFPGATCSDGTPGTFYVRPGIGADADRWVIHVQGGGSCTDYESCHERWCGQQGVLPYTANKMSSDWDADGVSNLYPHASAGGMASVAGTNEFRNWTHVFAYYCSSDAWLGRKSNVTYSDGAGNSFDLDARGHTILSAMRRMLRKNNAAAPNWTTEGGYMAPDLDNATDIIFTGTSAGGNGALNNADWFLRPFNNAKTALVVDAAMSIGDTALLNHNIYADTNNDGTSDINYYSHRIGVVNDRWLPGGPMEKINAFADESCRAFYEPLGRMDRCTLPSTVLTLNLGSGPIIETETFIRTDLIDAVLRKQYTNSPNKFGFTLMSGSGAAAAPLTVDDFAALMRQTLVDLYADHDSVTGVIGPRCGDHVGLESNPTYTMVTAPDTDDMFNPPVPFAGTQASTNTAIWDWFNVGGAFLPERRIDTDGAGLSYSVCN